MTFEESNTQDQLQCRTLARSILMICVAKHGSVDTLAEHLGVEPDTLFDWVTGTVSPPMEIVQKAVQPFLK
ncbi:MAG TPA: hypothetical protein VM140_08160 [Burkholderiales bacterium]|nr:hypothetical protein [Burkholderiales bacterium]